MVKQRRVLHLMRRIQPGGIANQMMRVLPQVSGKYRHHFLGLKPGKSMKAPLRERGIRLSSIACEGTDLESDRCLLREAIHKARPDIIHVHDRYAAMLGFEAASLEGVRNFVMHYHTPEPREAWTEAAVERERRVLEGCSRILFCSESVKEDLAHRMPGLVLEKSLHLPNAIEPEEFRPSEHLASAVRAGRLPIKGDRPVIASISRLDPVKNLEQLIDAASLLRQREQDFELWIAGSGWRGYEGQLQAYARQAGLSDAVQFMGYHSRPADLLEKIDIFAIPSRMEGMPLGILEAWACGVPVVGTRVLGIHPMIEEGREGLLCELGSAESLADELERLLSDPKLRAELSLRGIQKAEGHHASHSGRLLEQVYESLST